MRVAQDMAAFDHPKLNTISIRRARVLEGQHADVTMNKLPYDSIIILSRIRVKELHV